MPSPEITLSPVHSVKLRNTGLVQGCTLWAMIQHPACHASMGVREAVNNRTARATMPSANRWSSGDVNYALLQPDKRLDDFSKNTGKPGR